MSDFNKTPKGTEIVVIDQNEIYSGLQSNVKAAVVPDTNTVFVDFQVTEGSDCGGEKNRFLHARTALKSSRRPDGGRKFLRTFVKGVRMSACNRSVD